LKILSKTSTRFQQNLHPGAGISQPSLTLRGVPLQVDPGGEKKKDRKTRRLAARGVALEPARQEIFKPDRPETNSLDFQQQPATKLCISPVEITIVPSKLWM